MDEKIYYQALARFDKIGPLRLRTLLKTFSTAKQIWEASAQDLVRAGLDENVAAEFAAWRHDQNLEKQREELDREGIEVVTWNDTQYPALLKEIHDPPHTLFIRGKLPQNPYTLAVVGTRMVTPYGRQIVEQIVAPLARAGLTIVSGLALGVDALAHEATLRERGTTIAVLGGGCDKASIYPTSNRGLAERLIEQEGALVSEYPPATLAVPYHFPHRNRIISGLSRGTLVIEAAEDSGSLITANHSLEQNREVFVVPGDINRPTSVGPNNLLKMGAHPVLAADDVLDALNLQDLKATLEAKSILPDNPMEEKILAHLIGDPIHIDELIKATQMNTAEVSSALTLMEMKGKVRHIGGQNYVLAR
ncbi:MAG: protecting protein DprA protein [Candidatus Magasanikbacteria bacterium GW2011_GWA2_50_22]|uniref:Protecting protein DprA protein n=1 Tax=Candidatus Magasanikbacteria bacterium GW2011_GWA2_50_22 TaxID=1619043 RepID=A0A0G1YQW3_9BACT|nr:MAG: protecting protein DprA protein [Candidatus Magasanikbacteria bacterium GW2011_GWA2_50_22]